MSFFTASLIWLGDLVFNRQTNPAGMLWKLRYVFDAEFSIFAKCFSDLWTQTFDAGEVTISSVVYCLFDWS